MATVNTDNLIELPLDPEFVTLAGAYQAGYIWGRHVRSPKDARHMFPGDSPHHEDFYKCVEDGYYDRLRQWIEPKTDAIVGDFTEDVL